MIIKDEIHGTVEFSDLEERIIDSRQFQRLRRIKQMSVTNLVYPGANHTRFEHSIGTAHLSSLIAKRLDFDDEEIRKVKLYGLLHDIGHTPFSHEGEHVLSRYVGDHEKLGEKKILNGEIADILSENYDPKDILKIGKEPSGNIIESDIGSDRMDYLERDAQNTGVAYGIIDIDRIIHTLAMNNGKLCIERGGLGAAEYLLVARFMMFSTVYLHKTVRIATAMLYEAIRKAIEDGLSPEKLADMNDEQAMQAILETKGSEYAKGLENRVLYKEVCTLQVSEAEKAKKIGEEFSEVIVDYPDSFFKPIDFMIKTDDGLVPITKMSKVVQSLKKAEEERMHILVLAKEKDVKEIRSRLEP